MTDDLKKLAEAAKVAARGKDLGAFSEAWAAWERAATPDAFLNLIRERDEAQRAGVEAVGLLSRVAEHIGDDAPLSREIYAFLGKPNSKGFVWAKVVKEGRDLDTELDRMRSTALAAVTTAEARAEAAEAALSAAQEEVARQARWLNYVERELVAAMERGQLHTSLHVLVTGTKEPTDG